MSVAMLLAVIAAILFGLAALGLPVPRGSLLAAGACVLTVAFIVAGAFG